MSFQKRRLWLSVVVVGMLGMSVLLGLSTLGILPGHVPFAAAAGVTSTDYYPPAGSDPWGTAFDSSGHVWVALPGCDPSPTCSTSTPPGRIAEFDPTTKSWITDFQLPSGGTRVDIPKHETKSLPNVSFGKLHAVEDLVGTALRRRVRLK